MSTKNKKKFKQPIQHQQLQQEIQSANNSQQMQIQEENMNTQQEVSHGSSNRHSNSRQKDQSNCKSAFLFILLCVSIMGLIFLVSIAANCLLEHQNLQPANFTEDWNKNTNNVKASQQTSNRVKQLQNTVVQLNRKNRQIASQLTANQLNPGSGDQQRIVRLQNEIRANQQKSNTLLKQLSNQNQQLVKELQNSKTQLDKQKKIREQVEKNNIKKQDPKQQAKPEQKKPQQKKPEEAKKQSQQIANVHKSPAPKTFKVRQHFRDFTPKSQPQFDRYQFTTAIQNVVDQSGLKSSTYQRAIRLMEVVHNINIKGEMQFDHFNFYNSAQDKFKAFTQILQEEYDYFDKKYEISKYNKNQIGICISSPTFNPSEKSRLYLRNLDSVFQQQYDNYHIVITNDASTDGTAEYLKKYMEVNNIPAQKYTIINNQKNMGGSHNTYVAGHQHCKQGEIMIYLDGDDVLIGRQVFSFLNAFYQREKCTLTYGQFLLVRQNSVSSGFSTPIPQNALEVGPFRKLRAFYTSHLKSMYVNVFRAIPENHFHYDNGTWFDYAFDVVFMTPGVQLSGPRAKFVNELIYEYRFDTGGNQPGHQQKRVEMLVYEKPALKRMQDFSFADNPITKAYP